MTEAKSGTHSAASVDALVACAARCDPGFPDRLRGADPGQIERLEELAGYRLPDTYRRFLQRMGQDTDRIQFEDCHATLEFMFSLDEAPRFDPLPGTAEHEAHDWRILAVHCQEEKRPIIFHKGVNAPEVWDEVIEEGLGDERTTAADALRRHLLCCRQMIAIEASALVSPTEEAWAMIDSIEAHLAHKYRGIRYVPYEGFFDETLQAISLSDADGTPKRGRI